MTTTEEIKTAITNKLGQLSTNVTVIDSIDKFNFESIENGILILYSFWSGQALHNIYNTLDFLYKQNDTRQIIVIDLDVVDLNYQKNILGQLCEGWGEIFVIETGKITQCFCTKDSYEKFIEYERKMHSR